MYLQLLVLIKKNIIEYCLAFFSSFLLATLESKKKNTVDSLRNQGCEFTAGGIPPAQIKSKYDYSDIYNLNWLIKGQ